MHSRKRLRFESAIHLSSNREKLHHTTFSVSEEEGQQVSLAREAFMSRPGQG